MRNYYYCLLRVLQRFYFVVLGYSLLFLEWIDDEKTKLKQNQILLSVICGHTSKFGNMNIFLLTTRREGNIAEVINELTNDYMEIKVME